MPAASVVTWSSGGAELAGVPGQRGADPWRQERGAGPGVRGRAGVEPDGQGSGGAPVHGARGQARHRLPGGEAVTVGWSADSRGHANVQCNAAAGSFGQRCSDHQKPPHGSDIRAVQCIGL